MAMDELKPDDPKTSFEEFVAAIAAVPKAEVNALEAQRKARSEACGFKVRRGARRKVSASARRRPGRAAAPTGQSPPGRGTSPPRDDFGRCRGHTQIGGGLTLWGTRVL